MFGTDGNKRLSPAVKFIQLRSRGKNRTWAKNQTPVQSAERQVQSQLFFVGSTRALTHGTRRQFYRKYTGAAVARPLSV